MTMMQSKDGFKNQRQRQFPQMLCLEITNVCNLRCIHCPYTAVSRRKEYRPRFMDWKIFKKIADEASKFPDTILRFVCDGEPMMHPDFLSMAEYAKAASIESIGVTTNGIFLNENNALRLIKIGCNIIEVSIDALNKSTYEKVRLGGDFDLVRNNTLKLIEIRNALNADIKIIVSIIDQPDAHEEIAGFQNYWKGKADKVLVRKLTSIGGLVDNFNGRDKQKGAVMRWPCPILWRRMFINVDGFAEFCVDDWLDESVVGDVQKNSIQDIWQNQAYRQLRQAHFKKEFSFNKKCKRCADWQARTWDYDYFTALESLGIKTG